jgi:hypothetical protein
LLATSFFGEASLDLSVTSFSIGHNSSTKNGSPQSVLEIFQVAGVVRDTIQEVGISEVSASPSFLEVGIPQVSFYESSTNQAATSQVRPTQICLEEASTIQSGSRHSNVGQISLLEKSSNSITVKNGIGQVSITENSASQIGIPEIGTLQIGFPQISRNEQSIHQFSLRQINALQIGTDQISIEKGNSTEISLPTSITLQQFLSSHNFNLQNTTIPTWTEFLTGTTPFNLKIEIRLVAL